MALGLKGAVVGLATFDIGTLDADGGFGGAHGGWSSDGCQSGISCMR